MEKLDKKLLAFTRKKFRKAVIQSALQSNFGFSSSPRILFHLLFFLIFLPDGDHDGWGHLHWTDFCLRFPKIYDTWGIWGEIVIKNFPVLGGHSWSFWPSWWWSLWLGPSPLNYSLPKVSKNIWYMGYLWDSSHKNLPVLGGCSSSSWPSWWWSWWLRSSPLNCILPKVSKNIRHMWYLRRNNHQEPSCTWRMFLIILTFLMVIMMIGVISIELHFA